MIMAEVAGAISTIQRRDHHGNCKEDSVQEDGQAGHGQEGCCITIEPKTSVEKGCFSQICSTRQEAHAQRGLHEGHDSECGAGRDHR